MTVRDVDEAVWRRFRAKTEEEGLRTGQALNEALNQWVKEKERKRNNLDPRKFLKVEGIVRVRRSVKRSEEKDEVLHG